MKMRLALREEGSFWNAYIASEGTMEGAIHLGSIAIGAAKANPEIKDRFMQLMQDAFSDAASRSLGQPIDEWSVGPAPEHERAGRA